MSIPTKSQADLQALFINALQNQAPDLTDTLPGSTIDILAGVFSTGANELSRLITDSFNKTFFDLANGPEVTLGADDLQTLAVDHFGAAFARPQAVAAVDTVTFSRPTNAKGAITIPAGTIVKTAADANGAAQRYATQASITLTSGGASDLTLPVGVTAVVPGKAGSATAGTITVIESTLLDSTIVCTNAGNATGSDAQNDAAYRETIRNLVLALRGATLSAIQATAKTVAGIVTATAVEVGMSVKQYNIATGATTGAYFYVPQVNLYVADATGSASTALLQLVRTAIDKVRAAGVYINVLSASSISVNWTAHIVLNPAGPNYALFQTDLTQVKATMTNYISALPVGTSFVRSTAEAAVLAVWGAAGTNDLTTFSTTLPVADIAATATQKMVPGTIGTA